MKILLPLSLLALSLTASAEVQVSDFNKTLLENVEKEIKHDDQKYRKASPGRGPASVTEESVFHEDQKIDKNQRQIGPNKW